MWDQLLFKNEDRYNKDSTFFIVIDGLTTSIDALVERAHISRNFIGLILIPIVGNAAEHVTAVVVAVKNKMDLVRS